MASSHLITTCATLAALILFVLVGAKVLPSAMGLAKAGQPAMVVAFLLNIAIILFGWRRANDLNQTLSALKAAEQEALANAYTDHTTGLGNRRSILNKLDRVFREGGPNGALVVLDLDHFKKVNDLYGHAAGDQLLKFTGETIREELPPSSFAARLGGDEFAAYIADAAIAEEVTRRIVAKLAAPINLGPVKTQLSASAGLTHLNRGLNPEEILRRADVAMYSVKRSGRNGIAWFDEEMSRQLQCRVALEEEIRAA
jgi:diguanylate cyclase (GGDEF)-like protein